MHKLTCECNGIYKRVGNGRRFRCQKCGDEIEVKKWGREKMRECSKCGIPKVISDFHNAANGPDGISTKCKVCHGDITKRWRNKNRKKVVEGWRKYSLEHPEIRREYTKRYTIAHPKAARARMLIRHALRAGRMIKPKRCEECGDERKLLGHHEDYEHPLQVMWCCYPCHAVIEKRKRVRVGIN